uniref:Uncharacterized protein n=1 Tax=Oryza barthii TaxID=65489 RepID=A0A0D3GHG1_9ORYZ
MTLGDEAESVRAFRTRCPLHQEVGSCVLELGPIERWALALRVRKAEEVLWGRIDNYQHWIAPPRGERSPPTDLCVGPSEEWKWKRIISMSTSKRTLAE